jgi:hypothetical protein
VAKLYDVLREKEGTSGLAQRLLTDVREEALKRLEAIRITFPQYTSHTIKHSQGVLDILDWLIPDSVKEQLNEWEIYFLIAAVYLHDVGMVERCPAPPSGEAWEEALAAQLAEDQARPGFLVTASADTAKRDFIRDHHHERSEEYIRTHARDLGLRATDIAGEGEIVGRISLGHRKVDLGDRLLFGEVPFGNNNMIRRDLLAAYLRLADELDTTALRTPLAEYEVLNIYDERSELEWAKHLALSGISLVNGVIVLAGKCYEHRHYLRLLKLVEELKAKLAELKRMIPRPYVTGTGFNVLDPLPFHDVDLRVEPEGFLPIEIGFKLQDSQIMQLIMGERLYGDKTACIREVLQNAVDTCREAQEVRPASWLPQIALTEEDAGRVLRIDDNGMGMDEYILRHYFSQVGISYYRSRDFKGSFRPTSEFGIGVLSCFMLADRLEIETRRDGADPLAITITSLTEPFIPKPGKRKELGTTIRMHLKSELVGKIDLPAVVSSHARYVKIPILVTTSDGAVHQCQSKELRPEPIEVFDLLQGGMRYSEKQKQPDEILLSQILAKVDESFQEVSKDGIALGVTLLDGPDGLVSWAEKNLFDSHTSLSFGQSFWDIYQDGFYIRNDSVRREWPGAASICHIDFTGESKLGLTVDRTRIISNVEAFLPIIWELYGEAVERIYAKRFKHSSPAIWWAFHSVHHYMPWPYDEGAATMPRVPGALMDSAETLAIFCTCSREGFKNRQLREVQAWPGRVTTIPPYEHDYIELVRHLLPEDLLVVSTAARGGRDGLDLVEALLFAKVDPDIDVFGGKGILGLFELGNRIPFATLDVGTDCTLLAFPAGWLGAFLNKKLTVLKQQDYHYYFNFHHPVVQTLINYCQRDLSLSATALLDSQEMLDLRDLMDGTFLHELLRVLKIDNVIPIECHFDNLPALPHHLCVYHDGESIIDSPSEATSLSNMHVTNMHKH